MYVRNCNGKIESILTFSSLKKKSDSKKSWNGLQILFLKRGKTRQINSRINKLISREFWRW